MMFTMALTDLGTLGWEETDYVWGPDYVDELAYLINPSGAEIYAVQDANFNVVGWAKQNGVAVANFVRGPYGDLRVAEYKNPTSPPRYALGHQGLFFVRFDGDADDTPFEPGAKGLYYNRNRWYSPELGRFTTQDVNAAALPILTALAFNGEALNALMGGFDAQSLYGDGMNLYHYAGGNPQNRLDALGLDFWDDCMDAVNDRIGHAIATLGMLNEGARWASIGLESAVGIAASFLPGAGIYDAYKSGVAAINGEAGFWDYVAIGAGAVTGGAVVYKAFKWARRMYASSKIASRTQALAKAGSAACRKSVFVNGVNRIYPNAESWAAVLAEDGTVYMHTMHQCAREAANKGSLHNRVVASGTAWVDKAGQVTRVQWDQ